MRYFRNIIFALAALLWLPASVHCELETIPGLEFLHCVDGGQKAHDACADCGGCTVEKSLYHSEQNHCLLTPPDLLPAWQPSLTQAENPLSVEVGISILLPPPQLLKTWHFVSRKALPVRAPSLAS